MVPYVVHEFCHSYANALVDAHMERLQGPGDVLWGLVADAMRRQAYGSSGTMLRESLVRAALGAPDEVRQSRIDSQVLLFYKAEATRRWTCAVARRAAEEGFLITAYPTDAIKEGVRIWPK